MRPGAPWPNRRKPCARHSTARAGSIASYPKRRDKREIEDMNNLKGKVAWITGAGTGIGLAGAQALAEAGAIVVMSGRRKEVLAPEAEKIRIKGGPAEGG